MAKKDLTKIELEIEEAKKKIASLENERKLAEEKLQKISANCMFKFNSKKTKHYLMKPFKKH